MLQSTKKTNEELELENWKRKLEQLENERAKEAGKLEQLMKQLSALGISSLEEGRRVEAERVAQHEKNVVAARELLAALKEKYREYIA